MKYYHATPLRNLYSILEEGIRPGCDNIVYLAETREDACKFIALRCLGEDILVIEVELDEALVEETFDHSFSFFKCRAFGYPKVIPLSQMTDFWKFTK